MKARGREADAFRDFCALRIRSRGFGACADKLGRGPLGPRPVGRRQRAVLQCVAAAAGVAFGDGAGGVTMWLCCSVP
jgi:hypothetical protein